MSGEDDEGRKDLVDVRGARRQAEMLRDLLAAEYQKLLEQRAARPEDAERWGRGLEALRKAIAAADHAIASLDQALREMERVRDEPGEAGGEWE